MFIGDASIGATFSSCIMVDILYKVAAAIGLFTFQACTLLAAACAVLDF